MKKISLLALPLFLLGTASANAAVIQVGAFVGSDGISWAQLGPDLTAVGTPTAVTTDNGDAASISNAGGGFTPCTEGFCVGELSPGETMLASFDQAFSIDFTNPVDAVGAQVFSNAFTGLGGFTAELRVFDAALVHLGTFQVAGHNFGDSLDHAPFLGAQSDAFDISRAVFAITFNDGADSGVIIGDLEIGPAVPEPASLSLVGLGLAAAALRRRTAQRNAK